MAEEPIAEPEPVRWGTDSDPFPVGTQIEIPNDNAPSRGGISTVIRGSDFLREKHPNAVFFGEEPLTPSEVQGRIDEEGWRVAGYTYTIGPSGYSVELTEARLRAALAYQYGGDNRSREFHKNVREDSHETVGSIIYSLDGSPPKGYAIHVPELSKISLYSGHGERFHVYHGTITDWEDDEQ
jgi:hypothetical protein